MIFKMKEGKLGAYALSQAAAVHPASETSTVHDKLRLRAQRSKGRAELTFMMEQYLDGPEVDVDVVLNAEGDVVYGNVTDNWPTIEPYFNETGKLPSSTNFIHKSGRLLCCHDRLAPKVSHMGLQSLALLAKSQVSPRQTRQSCCLDHMQLQHPAAMCVAASFVPGAAQGQTAPAFCRCTSSGSCASSAWRPSSAWASQWACSMWSANTHL